MTTPDTKPTKPKRRLLRWFGAAVLLFFVALGLGAFYFHGRLEASLPTLDGSVAAAGLNAPVTIERDALGVVTVKAETRADLAQGLGFAHAQDRFFQMEYYRRTATGELAEMLGGT
ncbi:MAG: penicillin acylase family protein, partial [Acidobacteriota bacterium]